MTTTLDLTQDGHLNLITRKGFQIKFDLKEVPQAGFTYAFVVKNDAGTTLLNITGTLLTDRVRFFEPAISIATGPYRYDVIVTKTADNSKRCSLSGNLVITP